MKAKINKIITIIQCRMLSADIKKITNRSRSSPPVIALFIFIFIFIFFWVVK